ncbi:MAG TPA: agmatine deiminase family protein, partial [Lentimicrobium sp.]|nr:agmatine deiminase family protein [Lentimicrobium sp.]
MIKTLRTISILILLVLISSEGFPQRRMVAEWEPAFGTLIRWPLGIPGDLVVELARHDTVYVLVENSAQQSQASYTFSSYGVNLNHCRFITANTWSHWTRDWGPHYVFNENGQAGIADPMFDGYPWVPGCNANTASYSIREPRGYEEDDAVNITLAEELGLPLISFTAYLTGGNIMTDGQGRAFSTRQMLDESAQFCNEVCFMNIAEELLGIQQYFITENPEVYGIQHIDCYDKFLDE